MSISNTYLPEGKLAFQNVTKVQLYKFYTLGIPVTDEDNAETDWKQIRKTNVDLDMKYSVKGKRMSMDEDK